MRLQNSKKWDLVIVDEIRSILGQLTSDKNKANMSMNNQLIRVFMRNADAVLLISNDDYCVMGIRTASSVVIDLMVRIWFTRRNTAPTTTFKPGARRYAHSAMQKRLF